MRPIFSPTDFIQIRGRGTRPYTFSYKSKEAGEIKARKATFKLFDFFANCEYFEEKFNYDEVIHLPPVHKGPTQPNGGGTEGIAASDVTLAIPDPLKVFSETPIGVEGMKIDRKIFEDFKETVKNNTYIKEIYHKGDMATIEEYVKKEIFDKPEEYFNLEKLRKAINIDRRISLREIIEPTFRRRVDEKRDFR